MAADQTPRRYKGFARVRDLGTGVFLRLGASGETEVTFQPNLSYANCVQQGEYFEAFKWVPDTIATYSAVVASRCVLVGERCSKSCDADGCLCNAARQQCVDASGNAQAPPGTGSLEPGNWDDEVSVEDLSDSYRTM